MKNNALILLVMLLALPLASAAQANPADCYNYGVKCYNEKSYAKALPWFIKAANQQHAKAQCFVGYFYENGLGVKKDVKEAASWYTLAANNGDATAQYCIGLFYE